MKLAKVKEVIAEEIINAIKGERERCARVAEAAAYSAPHDNKGQGMRGWDQCAAMIAERIRSAPLPVVKVRRDEGIPQSRNKPVNQPQA